METTPMNKPWPTKAIHQKLSEVIDENGLDLLDREAVRLALHLLQALNIRDTQTVDIPEDLEEPSDIARCINRMHGDEINLISLNTV